MKALNNIKRSRLKIAMYTNIFLGLTALYGMYIGETMTTVSTTCIAGILTISTMFIGGDSMRKSD